ncbi:ribonucleotide reductase [Magnetospirillum sp. UT-4]|uniref:TSCPD domain-containing protein n=1 Tax=Magnetospirillum sp. UT-4 TaxID=2681467 RepID=UPI001384A39A|nr:ribonucleotide reductase [Magnetospirillum sp. UT-4]CAA7621132.1 conserved hypothetical protein [Magnetospirillum sp. UT-4]
MERQRLPNRRLCLTETLEWCEHTWLMNVGFDVDGRVREVFIDGNKVGSLFEGLLDDACVLVSHLLQIGRTPADLVRRLGGSEAEPASPIGLVARQLARLEADAGVIVREVYALAGQRGAAE